METTTERMIAKLNQRIASRETAIDSGLTGMRRDFEVEATRIKSQLAKIGEAVVALVGEVSRDPQNPKLCPAACKPINDLLN